MTDLSKADPATFTEAQYKQALVSLGNRVTDTHRNLLRAHYHAPGHTVSVRELSEAVGWKGASASVHYGRLAGLLCEILGKYPGADNVFVIAELIRPEENDLGEWQWVMRPALRSALGELGWV